MVLFGIPNVKNAFNRIWFRSRFEKSNTSHSKRPSHSLVCFIVLNGYRLSIFRTPRLSQKHWPKNDYVIMYHVEFCFNFFEEDDMFWKWITCLCRDDDDNKAEKKGAKESLFWMNEYTDGNSQKGIHWVFRNLFSNKEHIICNVSST